MCVLGGGKKHFQPYILRDMCMILFLNIKAKSICLIKLNLCWRHTLLYFLSAFFHTKYICIKFVLQFGTMPYSVCKQAFSKSVLCALPCMQYSNWATRAHAVYLNIRRPVTKNMPKIHVKDTVTWHFIRYSLPVLGWTKGQQGAQNIPLKKKQCIIGIPQQPRLFVA